MERISKQYGFDFDVERCVQCHACEVACKSFHDVEPGVKRRRIASAWEGQYPDVRNMTISLACLHCGEPACESVCPTGAIQKRTEDGIVMVDQAKCIGCHCCFLACPFGVPQYGEDGKMQKCDLCANRLDQGKEPPCVATCPAEALHFGTMNELADRATGRLARKLLSATSQARINGSSP
jgi:anaerobic dimethyl sulfoxide reductase subunit B (iron-sulfur subunit)